VLEAEGAPPAALPSFLHDLATQLVSEGRSRAGYVLLGEEGQHRHLYQVVFEPRTTGEIRAAAAGARTAAGVLVLRDVGSDRGPGLLEKLPFGSQVERSFMLGDGTVLARFVGSQSSLSRGALSARSDDQTGTGGAAGAAREDWPATLADASGEGIDSRRVGDVVVGARPLHDLSGNPVALAVVRASMADLLPEHERPSVHAAQVRSLLGWIALTGVLLAIAIGVLAPRWVWSHIRDATDSIFHSVERLRELVRRNSRAIDEQSRVMKTLTASASSLKLASQSIADTTRTLAHSAEQSAWVSQSGNQKAELSQRAVVEVRDRVEQISSQMEELERRCGDIGKILGFIDHLSNETNTLSVNATIQAVGAGSSGRQFSVVAGEIRKLADLALESTRDIQQLIEQIQESSRTTLLATQEGRREVDRCLQSFEDLESAFARILRWVEETTRGSHGIEQSTARQSDSLQSVVQSIEALEQRASETSGNFHEVVSAADELARLGADMNETWRVG
jgi:hypothetical protein